MKYTNDDAVSILVGTLLLILVVTVATVSIAIVWAELSKDSGNKIGISASVIDRGMPVSIVGDASMVNLTQALVAEFSQSNPTLYIKVNDMNQTSAIKFLYAKGTDLVMYNGTLPKLEPEYTGIKIGNSTNQSIYLIRRDSDIVTKPFVDYARSPDARDIFVDAGFTSITDDNSGV